MEIPAGFSNGELKRQYVLKLDKNLYGLKNAAFNWFQMLSDGLTNQKLNFKASEIDPCVFYRKNYIILTYVDDCIILSKDLKVIDKVVLANSIAIEIKQTCIGRQPSGVN